MEDIVAKTGSSVTSGIPQNAVIKPSTLSCHSAPLILTKLKPFRMPDQTESVVGSGRKDDRIM